MNIGVIGANGFLGSNIAARFVTDGHNVFSFYNRGYENIPSGSKRVSIADINSVDVNFDILFIAIGSHASTHLQFIEQLGLVKKLLEELRYNRVVYISSVAVYGEQDEMINVATCYRNMSLYGLSKLATEFVVSAAPSYAIIRPTYIYGNGMNNNSLIPKWVSSAKENSQIVVFGNGQRMQDYLHIKDAVDLCSKAALSSENLTVIGATGRSISNRQLALLIQSYCDKVEIVTQPAVNAASFWFDVSHTKAQLGWSPKVEFEDGLKQYVAHAPVHL